MTVTHTGSTQKFSEGWQKIFGKSRPAAKAKGAPKPAKKKAKK